MCLSETLDEERLAMLVNQFYAKVRADALLGPLFNRAVADWPEHLEKLAAFWSSVMLTTGRYSGRPMQVHMRHQAEMSPAMFQRWLALWEETATSCLEPADAVAVIDKAHRIAASLQMGLFPLSFG
ncbi:MAG TPA: group III truncated hemoglobin [Acidocella sp.]|nr:group III truncated hemoglobin [Acidocella sp.]